MTASKSKPRTRRPKDGTAQPGTPAWRVVNEAFGGLAKLHELSGIPTSTIWGWLQTGIIPTRRVPELMRLAQANRIRLPHSHFVAL